MPEQISPPIKTCTLGQHWLLVAWPALVARRVANQFWVDLIKRPAILVVEALFHKIIEEVANAINVFQRCPSLVSVCLSVCLSLSVSTSVCLCLCLSLPLFLSLFLSVSVCLCLCLYTPIAAHAHSQVNGGCNIVFTL